MRLSIAARLLLLTGLLGCGPEVTPKGMGGADGGPPPAPDGLVAIEITPADATIYVANGVAGTQDYTATGHFADGTTRDLTTLVGWGTENMSLASFPEGGHLLASGVQGGRGVVHATAGSIDATATIQI